MHTEGSMPWKWCLPPLQLEDLEVSVADHIQKVMKVNFEAAWDEVGDEFEKEETFTLSTIKTLEGRGLLVSTTCLPDPWVADSAAPLPA